MPSTKKGHNRAGAGIKSIQESRVSLCGAVHYKYRVFIFSLRTQPRLLVLVTILMYTLVNIIIAKFPDEGGY